LFSFNNNHNLKNMTFLTQHDFFLVVVWHHIHAEC
jgi:hypothetical protein